MIKEEAIVTPLSFCLSFSPLPERDGDDAEKVPTRSLNRYDGNVLWVMMAMSYGSLFFMVIHFFHCNAHHLVSNGRTIVEVKIGRTGLRVRE